MACREVEWFDAHLDLACMALAGRDMRRTAEATPPLAIKGLDGRAAVTFPALAEGKVTGAVGTVFVQQRNKGSGMREKKERGKKEGGKGGEKEGGAWCFETEEEAYAAAWGQVELYRQWAREGWITLAAGGATEGKGSGLRVVLMLEGAAGVRQVEDMGAFYAAGVRIVSLTWQEGSKWAGGNASGGDLTAAGRKLVAEMDRLGMVHDVSHLSERAFWSLLEAARGPVAATHSNCRALLEGRETNERHLTDAQIRALAARGGMIGLNLFTRFLATGRRATLADCVRHVMRMVELAGRRDGVGLGSDMDGMLTADDLPVEVDHPRHLHRLAEGLAAAGFSDAEVAGFMGGNWRRFLKRHAGLEL